MQDTSFPTLHGSAPFSEYKDDTSPLGPMLAYWNSLPRHKGLPARAAIEPDAIRRYLSVSGILERRRSGRYAIRLAGQGIERRFGMTLRGLPVHSLVDLESRARLDEAVTSMFETPGVVRVTLGAADDSADTAPITLMLLPLCDDEGAPTRAMIVLSGADGQKAPHDGFRVHDVQIAPIATQEAAPVVRANGPVLRVIEGGLSGQR